MYNIVVGKSRPLRGNAWVSSAKNAVLPLMCGALLTGEDAQIFVERVTARKILLTIRAGAVRISTEEEAP